MAGPGPLPVLTNIYLRVLLPLLLFQPLLCIADNFTNPVSIFYSRPDLISPILTIEKSKPDLLSPGYFFLGAYQSDQDGPYIYDNGGNLIWSGFGAAGPGISHGIHVCTYKNEPHLCFFQGVQMNGYGKGHGIIMDKHYRIVKSVEAAGSGKTMDLHEFYLLPDGKSALMTVYQPRAYDLSAYGVTGGMGWVQEGMFQEIDVESGELLFEWRSLDYVSPAESFVPPATTEISGDGLSKDTPWDYIHINSIDKNKEGDYLISLRHTWSVLKISGKDGSILWRLNGPHSDFHLQDFIFSYQHDARWLSENATHTVISIFDNASNGYNETQIASRGQIIELNHIEMTAKVLQEYGAPVANPAGGEGMQAKSQGNSQVLPDGHVVSGWGNNCFITEHLPDGTPIFYAWTATTGAMIYRVYKANWTAEPLTQPNVWSYSKSKQDMAFYASWNGATEVTHWNFYTSEHRQGPFELAATVAKDGFETVYQHSRYAEWVYMAALHNGTVLKNSSIESTFVPGPTLAHSCDEFKCAQAPILSEEEAAMERQRIEEEAQVLRLEEEQTRRSRNAAIAQIVGSTLILMGILLISRRAFRCKCVSWYQGCKEMVAESRTKSVATLQLWRGKYTRVGNG